MKTILSKKDILALIQQKPPLVEDYVNLEEQLQPNGLDLTLKEVAMIQSGGQIAVSNEAAPDFQPMSAGIQRHGQH